MWLWDEYPDKWGNRRDLGTDLLFKTYDDELWAMQAKCHAETTPITVGHVANFLDDSNQKSVSKRLFMVSTDKIGPNAIEKMKRQQEGGKPVIRFLLYDFENAEINYPKDYRDLRSVKKK